MGASDSKAKRNEALARGAALPYTADSSPAPREARPSGRSSSLASDSRSPSTELRTSRAPTPRVSGTAAVGSFDDELKSPTRTTALFPAAGARPSNPIELVSRRPAARPLSPAASAAASQPTPGLAASLGGGSCSVGAYNDASEAPVLVPTVLHWPGAGTVVFVTGSFNHWRTRIPLHGSASDWSAIVDLPVGRHEYKFIVDGVWQHAASQSTTQDEMGNVNNVVDVRRPEALDEPKPVPDSPPGEYGRAVPDPAGYAKPPAVVPPHLQRCILNTWRSKETPSLLPIPHHTQISHLYCEVGSSSYTVVSETLRYKQKFTTTVYCSPH